MKKIFFIFALLATFVTAGYLFRPTSAQGKPEFVPNQVLVKFKDNTSGNEVASAHRAAHATFKSEIAQLGVQVVKVDNVGAAISSYARNGRVEYAEPDYYYKALVDDTEYGRQWGFNNTGQTISNTANTYSITGTADADIDMPEAWEITPGDPSVVIAVLDSGVDQDHPDLTSKLVDNINFTGSNSYNDYYGHGTHTSGIAAAATNNDRGVAGTGYNSALMNVKVLGDDGYGASSWIAQGILYAADNGAKVISMSMGSPFKSSTLENAVNEAWSEGAILVASAGNSANPSKTYPAYYSNVIAVAATDNNDQKADFSSYGSWVDVAAPGVDIYSTFPTHDFVLATKYNRSQEYDFGSGTSMSAPMVAGVAALVWSTEYGTGNQAVRDRIEHTADAIPGTGTYWTWGRVNACNAVGGNCTYDLGSIQTPTPTPSPSPTTSPSPAPSSTPVPTPDDTQCFKGVPDGRCMIKDGPMCSDCL